MQNSRLPFLIQCRKCKSIPNTPAESSAEYIGQTKRALRDRFGEHRRAIQSKIDDVVPQHFYQPGHQLKDIELINAKRESIRIAGERSSIEKAQTAQPQGIDREDDR